MPSGPARTRVMVLPISYWKLSEREIAQHYAAIGAVHRHSDHGVQQPGHQWHRHAAGTAGSDVQATSTTSPWSRNRTGDITAHGAASSELSGGQLPFYNGSNPMVLKAFKAGAKGWCTAAPNLLPQPCLDLHAAARAGDWTKADAIYTEIKPFLEFIVAGGLPTTIKGGLELLGQGVGDAASPVAAARRRRPRGVAASSPLLTRRLILAQDPRLPNSSRVRARRRGRDVGEDVGEGDAVEAGSPRLVGISHFHREDALVAAPARAGGRRGPAGGSRGIRTAAPRRRRPRRCAAA